MHVYSRLRGSLCGFVLAGGAIVGAGMMVGGPAASASADPSGGGTVGATPILQLMSFGDTTGLPLACQLSTSLMAGAAPGTSPIVTNITEQCNQLSAQGQSYLNQAITASEHLNALNPVLDPVFVSMSSALKNLGTNYGPQLAPFGPMIAGLGSTVAFFEGS